MKSETESFWNVCSSVEEQDKGKHGCSHTANEKVAKGKVKDHEIKVGSEFPEGGIEEGQEDD